MNTVWVAISILGIFGLVSGIILGCALHFDFIEQDSIIKEINNLLPQSQCGKCGYPGCLPYAEAIGVQEEKINRCSPGGEAVMLKIANVLNIEPQPLEDNKEDKEMMQILAVITESQCIGCTKCMKICPVDAIIGSMRVMHTIMVDLCIGCNFCVAICPMQCIKLRSFKINSNSWKINPQTIPVDIISV